MSKWFWHLVVAAMAVLSSSAACYAAPLVAGEAQSFVFTDVGYFANKPISVYYYKAKSAGPDAKVLIAIHGMERNAKQARDNWQAYAEKHQLIVLAPEFDEARFSARLFNMANLEDRDRSHWTFQIVEHLFDFVRVSEQLATQRYLLFGHSAGGQFVHRFMLLTDDPKVSAAVAANAGSYTMPVFPATAADDTFPYALDERMVSEAKLRQVFARKLFVMLGEDDTQTDAANLPKARQAKAQGVNRLARGNLFFARAKAQARQLDTPFAWELTTVPGVGHHSRAMSKAAAKVLLESSP